MRSICICSCGSLAGCVHQARCWTPRTQKWARHDPYLLGLLLLPLFEKIQVDPYRNHTFGEYLLGNMPAKWTWLRTIRSGCQKFNWEASVSVYPWEAEGLVEWSSWKWEVRTIWKMLSEGQVFSITPNPLIGIYYYVVLSDGQRQRPDWCGVGEQIIIWTTTCL